jgi:hypothetical protein
MDLRVPNQIRDVYFSREGSVGSPINQHAIVLEVGNRYPHAEMWPTHRREKVEGGARYHFPFEGVSYRVHTLLQGSVEGVVGIYGPTTDCSTRGGDEIVRLKLLFRDGRWQALPSTREWLEFVARFSRELKEHTDKCSAWDRLPVGVAIPRQPSFPEAYYLDNLLD